MADKGTLPSYEMPLVDMGKELPSLSPHQRHFVEKFERINKDRHRSFKSMLTKNRLVGGFFALFAVCSYTYTMYAIKQEEFLEEFETVQQPQASNSNS